VPTCSSCRSTEEQGSLVGNDTIVSRTVIELSQLDGHRLHPLSRARSSRSTIGLSGIRLGRRFLAPGARSKIRVRYDRMIAGEPYPLLVRFYSSPIPRPIRVDCRRPHRSSEPSLCPDGLVDGRA
jgi:hypothetical protein